MKVYQKFLAALVIIFSGLAFVPFVEASFSGNNIWQQFADAYRPRISAENITFVSGLNLQSEHLAVDENYLYSSFNNLSVVDISNPSSLKVINKFPTEYVYDLVINGQFVFTAQQDFGVRAFDVSVGLPTVFSSSEMNESALGVTLADNTLYVANGSSGLVLIDATKPADLPILSQIDSHGKAFDVAASGNFAFLADGPDGLRVFDVSDKHNPKEITSLDTPGFATDVTLDGSFLYLADGTAGVRIYDVSTLSAPKEISVFNTSGTAEKITILGDFAYVADRQSGILILDIHDKTKPVKVAAYDTLGGAWDVVVKDGFIYVADFPYGVQVLKFIPPVSGQIPTIGGSLTTTPDEIKYVFGADAFSVEAVIKHQPLSGNGVPPSSLLFPKVGPFFIVSASDTIGNTLTTIKPYKITIPYTDNGLSLKQENTLGLYTWDGREWLLEPTSQVDPETNSITASPSKLILGGVLMDKAKSISGK